MTPIRNREAGFGTAAPASLRDAVVPLVARTASRAGGARQAGNTAAVLALAGAATALPCLAHLLGQPVGIAFCAVGAVLLANYASAAVPAALLCSYLFQNLAVSLVSPALPDPAAFDTIRGYNFLLTGTCWLVLAAGFWTGPGSRDPALRRPMLASTIVLAAAAAYCGLGLLSSPAGAAVYLRNIATPVMAFQACLLAAARSGHGLVATLRPLGIAILLYGYAEMIFRPQLFGLIHADSFFEFSMRPQNQAGVWLKELRETGRVIRGIEDTLEVDLFNTALLADLGVKLHRLMGPNFHPISFAYALSFFSLLGLTGSGPLYLVLAAPLLVATGSKGALVGALLPGLALLAFRVTRSRAVLPLVWAALAPYAGAAVALGLTHGDYHVMGLIGGLKGFLSNPLGHGLGAGGNLSIDMAQIDWNKSQALGSTDLAVESAIGVLLYQMGVAGLLVCALPCWLAARAWRVARETGRADFAVVAFGLATITANGLLQEEALFAPLALGALMLVAGLLFGGHAHERSRRR